MTPALARIKRAVRGAIGHCGGIDGAAATAERQRSVAGDWNNLNHAAFPPLDCAFAMDEATLAAGAPPAILGRYAAELGFALFQLPSAHCEAAESAVLIEAMQEFGEVAGAINDMLADGVREQHERDRVVREIDEAQAKLARLRAIVCPPVRSVAREEGAA